jgi:phosphomannomutase
MTGRDGRVLHIRPSGNAPELRLYVEADDADAAEALLVAAHAALAARLV